MKDATFSSARLLEFYERISDAEDAIPRLRRLVLDLAVRGKLVEQDAHDKPEDFTPSDKSEKTLGSRASSKKVPPSVEPYSLPKMWKWVEIGDQLDLLNGMAFKPSDWASDGLRIVRIQNLNRQDAPFNYCDPNFARERSLIDDGSFLISWSGTPGTSFGAFIWDRGPAVLNQHIFRCDFKTEAFTPKYLRLAINGRLDEMIEKAHGGVGLQHITKGKLEAMLIGLPPLAEQHRIVAKVDELMALCGQLEQARAGREAVRDRLTTASLARLTAPDTDAETFQSDARFALQSLPTLTTRPDQIKTLRQTILNLAVRGKLVDQDAADEPAAELLKRKFALPNGFSRRRKIIKEASVDASQGLLCELPETWTYVRIQDLYDANIVIDYADGNHGSLYPRSSEFGEEGAIFVSAKDLAGGKVNWATCSKLNRERASQLTKGWAQTGDVLLTHNATVGRVAIVADEVEPFLLGTSVTFYRMNDQALSPDYFFVALQSPIWQGQLEAIMAQTTRNQVSIQKQAFFQIPLPPIAEQHRIVAKVDELMALCNQLEASLTTTATTRNKLLNALLHEALEPAAAAVTSAA